MTPHERHGLGALVDDMLGNLQHGHIASQRERTLECKRSAPRAHPKRHRYLLRVVPLDRVVPWQQSHLAMGAELGAVMDGRRAQRGEQLLPAALVAVHERTL